MPSGALAPSFTSELEQELEYSHQLEPAIERGAEAAAMVRAVVVTALLGAKVSSACAPRLLAGADGRLLRVYYTPYSV